MPAPPSAVGAIAAEEAGPHSVQQLLVGRRRALSKAFVTQSYRIDSTSDLIRSNLDRDTIVTERKDLTQSLRVNGMRDLDSSMRNYEKIPEKVGRPPD
jgi:hypothetical protein